MEGISHEAASFAGHFKLGKLIGFYDDNRITIDGSTDLTFSDDTALRFKGYGWQVLHIADVNDLAAIDQVIAEAKADTTRPTLVVTRTHIGYGSPKKQDTASRTASRSAPMKVVATKKALGWPRPRSRSTCPTSALANWRKSRERGAAAHAEWTSATLPYRAAFAPMRPELDRRLAGKAARRLGEGHPDVHEGERLGGAAAPRRTRCSTRSSACCPS
jgi:transketolase